MYVCIVCMYCFVQSVCMSLCIALYHCDNYHLYLVHIATVSTRSHGLFCPRTSKCCENHRRWLFRQTCQSIFIYFPRSLCAVK